MEGSYYDIDAILAEEERIPVKFKTDAQKLGVFVPGSNNKDNVLEEGTKVLLPIWAARQMLEKELVSVELPERYRTETQNDLMAFSQGVNLKKLSPFYISAGLELCSLLIGSPESTALLRTLKQTVSSRYAWIVDQCRYSPNPKSSQASFKITEKLSGFEENLFTFGYNSSLEVHQWKERETNSVFTSHKSSTFSRKRKHD